MSSKGKHKVCVVRTVKFKKESRLYFERQQTVAPFIIGRTTAPCEIAFYPLRGKVVDHDGRVYVDPVYRQDEADLDEDVSRSMFERIIPEDILVLDANDMEVTIVFRVSVGSRLFATTRYPNISLRILTYHFIS